MKALPYLVSLVWVFGSCISSKDYVVETDYSYSGEFKRYQSYSFIQFQDNTLDSLVTDELIKNAISSRLTLLGYREDSKNPNLLIGYKIFFKDFTFQGYSQPELEEWLKNEEYFEETFDPVKYHLKEGTLFIFFVDRKKNKAIWQGYSSGLIDPSSGENDRFVRGSVRTIFDQYRVFAEGYMKQS